MFQIDAMSREPVYEQIIHQVEQFILTDVLQPEAQIPIGAERFDDQFDQSTNDSESLY